MATPLGTKTKLCLYLLKLLQMLVVLFGFFLFFFILFIVTALASIFIHVIIHILDMDLCLHTPRIS